MLSSDTDSCYRSTPFEIPERSSCSQDIADSTLESTDISRSYLAIDVDEEITMEYFLEPKDEEQPEILGHDLEMKLDDDQNTLGKDLETSPKASIDRHNQPDIDRHPFLDKLPGYIVEMEPVEEKMHKSKASHLAVPEHLRPPICAEKADGFHKRVKRIHDPVKFVVPYTIFEVEFPIPPDRSVHMGSYIRVLDDHQHATASQRGLRFKSDVDQGSVKVSNDTKPISSIKTTPMLLIDTCTTTRSDKSGGKKRKNWKKRKGIKGDPQLSLISHFSDGVRKYRVRSRCFSQPFAKLRALLIDEMIDKGEESMEAFTKKSDEAEEKRN
ncbi:hypothetical protein F2Q69_00059588 [Brassica cretica]|uniref:Uncharacterized protein n=1 Tax=Brassica cretica TaxID=69181 RepID=A0A8S9RF31_BRACR|nr:hypothetical protein F2Q69_00059588 [Brassica cretica]